MLFNSIEFLVFLPLVFFLYWIVPPRRLQIQNLLIVAASFLFYGWWDFRFLFLLILSCVTDFSIGWLMGSLKKEGHRKLLLVTSLLLNLGLLGFFKYYNFFADSFYHAFTFFGGKMDQRFLDVVLPVGISFYTFQSLSYTIDVYRKELVPTKNLISFLAFVSFFPQLVAGPIERATHLLPQFYGKRHFDAQKVVLGLRQMLWGFFKKMVIADNCAEHVNTIFAFHGGYSGSTLALGAVLFAFQIYGDFSGYSDIAIGTARLFGFSLMQNFAFPYFSRDIAEFWRRWHISLSTWFRDYVYYPLGGSRGSLWQKLRNTSIVFLLSGFWHGANWTFIVWGALNALYFIPLLTLNINRSHIEVVAKGRLFPTLAETLKMAITFCLVTLAWVFFRAATVHDALAYIEHIFTPSLLTVPQVFPKTLLLIIFLFVGVEWLGRSYHFALEHLPLRPWMRYIVYYMLLLSIYWFGNFSSEIEFIYFQF